MLFLFYKNPIDFLLPRTGRAGQKGTAYTLVTSKDSQFAGDLVKNLEHAEQRVPEALMQLAMQNPRFKKSRFREGKSSNPVKDRPGLGAPAARFDKFEMSVDFFLSFQSMNSRVINFNVTFQRLNYGQTEQQPYYFCQF